MKKLWLLIAILIAAIAAYFLLNKNLNKSGEFGAKDFALPFDPAIDKIFFSSNDKKAGYLIFTRDNQGIWWVENGKKKYPADTTSISDLLHIIMPRLEMKNPVNDASLAAVNRELAISGVKAEFFQGNNIKKTIYVGNQTPEELGTYMYIPGQSRPCVVEIPGHSGYLTPYFRVDINNWRTQNLIDIPASDIQSVAVKWNENPSRSFTIVKNGDNPYLINGSGSKINANRNRMLAYLDMFTGISREAGEPAGINKTKSKDSIIQEVPFFEIEIQTTNGQTQTLQIHHIKVSKETYTPETRSGELKVYETETYWAVLKGSDEIWIMQDVILRNRMKTLSDFIR